ncbi:MAG: hypothetical protein AAF378_25515 [Cyanobacteria bacterium P01_A01_bin.84]
MAEPQPGRYGDITFTAEILNNRFDLAFDYQITPKTRGFPSIQIHGDPLMQVYLQLRLHIDYNKNPTPGNLLSQFVRKGYNFANNENGEPLSFANRGWGNFVIDKLSFTFVQMIDNGEPEIIDLDLRLLQIN